MKLYTPDNTDLIEVKTIEISPRGLLIGGVIMGAMPMTAVLKPKDLRSGLRFVSPKLILHVLRMLLRRDA